jgi:hypothetical protein
MSLDPCIVQEIAPIISEFNDPHYHGDGRKRALELCRAVEKVFSERPNDDETVDALMTFFNKNVKCAWWYIMCECLTEEQVHETTAQFEMLRGPKYMHIQVHHVGLEMHNIDLVVPIGPDEFVLSFMPASKTIDQTDPTKEFKDPASPTPEEVWGSRLCYFHISGYFRSQVLQSDDRKRGDEYSYGDECSDNDN